MIFTKIAGWLLGGGIAAIGKELRQAHKDRLDAANEADRIDADIRVATLEAQQAVLIAEQGSWKTSWIRPAIAFPVASYLWKVLFYDKVLMSDWFNGVTDPLDEKMWWVVTAVIGAYFLTRPFEKRN